MARGQGTIYKRSGSPYYWTQVYIQGVAKCESTKTADRREALSILSDRVKSAQRAPKPTKAGMAELFELVIQDYIRKGKKDLYIVRKRLDKHLMPTLGTVRISRFSIAHVEKYTVTRQKEGAANATVNRELSIIHRALKLGNRTSPPKVATVFEIEKLPEDNARQGFIEKAQYEKLRDELQRARLPFVIGFHTGQRLGEILHLEWPMVDLPACEIRIPKGLTKAKKARTVPIYGELLDALKEAKAQHEREWPECRWVCSDGPARIRDFRGEWAVCINRAGMDGLKFHDLRRSAVRNMMRAGIHRKIAMQISGHSTDSIFDRYNIIDSADMQDAGAKLKAYLDSQPGAGKPGPQVVEMPKKKRA